MELTTSYSDDTGGDGPERDSGAWQSCPYSPPTLQTDSTRAMSESRHGLRNLLHIEMQMAVTTPGELVSESDSIFHPWTVDSNKSQ